MKRILEQLALRPLTLPQLFDFDESNGFAGRVAERKIDPPTFKGIFGNNDLHIISGPS